MLTSVRTVIARWARWMVVVVAVVPSLAIAAPRARVSPDRIAALAAPGGPATGSVCGRGEIRCFAHVHIDRAGQLLASTAPSGLNPADLQDAYQVDPGIATTPTVAIVDAYGYANLESDLAEYRRQFGLPPCTRSNGCLVVVNQNGQAQPLPPNPPADDDWTLETALDVDVVSAVCPRCKILVVQANSPSKQDLYTAQTTAAAMRPAVISDSWGGPEQGNLAVDEDFFDHPGIAQFAAAGDTGFNNGGSGPNYPSTSAHVIAVGGTSLVAAPGSDARGWRETAWIDGGSSCSLSIAKPAFQPASPCARRAAADIAAVGDPMTGVSVFNADSDGWIVLGGTSAAAPIVAAIFASIGRGDVTAAQIAQSSSALFDVTAGRNGSCGNLLCNAAVGWDGPTGFGTPSAARLAGSSGGGETGALDVKITSPADGATVTAGFKVTATASANAIAVGIAIDGVLIDAVMAPPYQFTAPRTLAPGRHLIQVAADDADGNEVVAQIMVKLSAGSGGGLGGDGTGVGGDDDGDSTRAAAGCNAGADPSAAIALVLVLAFGALARRHRARVAATSACA